MFVPVIRILSTHIEYDSPAGDWRLAVSANEFSIKSIGTGGFDFSSGVNLDNLALLIIAAKADAIQRGVNWQGE